MNPVIAIVGMACCYPDARTPLELWENVLARRRAFRRMPAERLLLEDYFSSDSNAPDSINISEAAVIGDYEFDRVRFRVSGPTFRSADPAHWLAVDVSDQALTDAGFSGGRGLPLETTGVLVGNTLTGEFSRASVLRLRWPFVRRVVEAQLRDEGWDDEHCLLFLGRLQEQYKAGFSPMGEETLAGSLSNTIAGRICNQFHFGGGGYTVDGACCSSLLAVAQACSALAAGDIDAAVAGGVDLSLDPFELVGFSRAGALAQDEMLVYDRNSSGFLPGEGSGFVVLMRLRDAQARGLRTYACIRGWGVSSDGAGGIMRPELRGQLLALQRAYQSAGYGPETVALFEGHGTGTPVGDEIELRALASARTAANQAEIFPAALGSIKANIGHTKAAAGVAGLIKAALAVHHRILPPATGVRLPRPEVDGKVLRVLEVSEPWPENMPLRAGVSSFGFGGINVHVTIEGADGEPDEALTSKAASLSSSYQDADVFLFDSNRATDLVQKIDSLVARAAALSYAELADLAATLAARLSYGTHRAAVVAATPVGLLQRLKMLRELLGRGVTRHLDADTGVFLGVAAERPRIGLLFPGQTSPVRFHGGAHARRFRQLAELYSRTTQLSTGDASSTHAAQLAVVTAELAGMRLLRTLEIDGSVAVGHSLGELAAYCWAGAMDDSSLLSMVDIRGRHMAGVSGPSGAMASVAASVTAVERLLQGNESLVIACFNASDQVVVAGGAEAIRQVVAKAGACGYHAALIAAAHAFHSPLMLPAQARFKESLSKLSLLPLQRCVISTITGKELDGAVDLHELLINQLTAPVRFTEALAAAAPDTDVFLEVGPGSTLTRLIKAATNIPAIAIDVAGPSLAGLLHALAAAYTLGIDVPAHVLFQDRFTRRFDLDRMPRFFANPCESVRRSTPPGEETREPARHDGAAATPRIEPASSPTPAASAVEIVRRLVARRTELPLSAVQESANLLGDFHLNSITVAELVAAAARELGMNSPRQLLEFAGSTVGELASSLERLRSVSDGSSLTDEPVPAGVDDWCGAFTVCQVPRALSPRAVKPQAHDHWRLFASPQHRAVLDSLAPTSLPGRGVLVLLSPNALEEELSMLLEAAQLVVLDPAETRYFVLVGEAALAASFARSVHLENPAISTRVIQTALDCRISGYIRDETSAAGGHLEAHYEESGRRSQPCLQLLSPFSAECEFSLRPGDVVLVSGGGKGIAAECALALARETKIVCSILGRSPDRDPETAATLERFESAGVKVKYFPVDVTDPLAVEHTVRTVEQLLGRVSGIIHGAGRNEPKLVRNLSFGDVINTFAPKVQGLRNLIAAVDPNQLHMLVAFSSVIGRVGLRGEAHYALANASLSRLTEDFARRHPACRCIAFESTAWSGLGMAERLGTVEALQRDGVHALTPEQGVSWFTHLLSRPVKCPSVVVTGRLGAQPPLPIDSPPMPLLRFLERPQVDYPGVELVADCDVSTISDPYLLHHVFQGQPLLPAVMGLEAMTQAAMAVTAEQRLPVLRDVRFERPLALEPGAHLTLRVAALVREPGLVEVVLRSSRTGFQLDHFRCLCSFREQSVACGVANVPEGARLPISPDRDLYGGLLFQTGWFRRLGGYRHLSARGCWAEIIAGTRQEWFSQYLPSTLLLGDPGARDAALHSVQACVPHATLLPVGVKRFYAGSLDPEKGLLVRATEQSHSDSSYYYDVELRTADGRLCELWEGLELRKVAEAPAGAWPEPLVAAFLEWRVRNLVPTAEVCAVFDRDHFTSRRYRSQRARRKALQLRQPHQASAKIAKSTAAGMGVSVAHTDGLTLAIAGQGSLACDMEPVRERSEQVWRDLLGGERWGLAQTIARESGQDVQAAATQVWTAQESLKKASAPHNVPLIFLSSERPRGSVSLAASGLRIASSVVHFRDDPAPFAVSVLVRSEECVTSNTVTASV